MKKLFLLLGFSLSFQFSFQASAQVNGETIDNSGGWVMGGQGPQNSASCGCPTPALPCSDPKSDDWPSRCLKENVNREKGRPVICYFNRRQNKREVHLYPAHKVPKGYPNNGLGGRAASQEIEFPGWPVEKKSSSDRVSEWGAKKLRAKYIERYNKEGKAPGDENQGYVDDQGMSWGHAWQIHHILEQKHNGTDVWGNMVPVFSGARTASGSFAPGTTRADNKHQDYTTWWQRVKVDSQFKNTKRWKKLKGCQYIKWPPAAEHREQIKNWSSGN